MLDGIKMSERGAVASCVRVQLPAITQLGSGAVKARLHNSDFRPSAPNAHRAADQCHPGVPQQCAVYAQQLRPEHATSFWPQLRKSDGNRAFVSRVLARKIPRVNSGISDRRNLRVH